ARPLPEIAEPERLVWVTPVSTRGGHALMMSYPDFADYRDSTPVFSDAAAMGDADFSISSGGEPVRVRGQWVSGGYFALLGVHMAVGRGFLAAEDRFGAPEAVAVISHRFWKERFEADAAVVGRRVVINGKPFTIVGVAPER